MPLTKRVNIKKTSSKYAFLIREKSMVKEAKVDHEKSCWMD